MEIKLPEKIKLDGWDIEVRPYLTLSECKVIADKMCECEDVFDRNSMLVACVMSACTNFFDNNDVEYTYEDIVYSGLWDDVLFAGESYFYDLSSCIELINSEVKRRTSLEGQLESISKAIDPKLIEQVIKAVEDNGSEQ